MSERMRCLIPSPVYYLSKKSEPSYTDKLLDFRWVQTARLSYVILFLYRYEKDFMDSLNHDNQADVIGAFSATSRYLDDLLKTGSPYFENMFYQIYPPKLQLNVANTKDTETHFFDLHFSIANGFVSSKIYDKRDDYNFDVVNFPFLDGDVPCVLRMVYTFRILLGLLESANM